MENPSSYKRADMMENFPFIALLAKEGQ